MADKYICLRQFSRPKFSLPDFMNKKIGIGNCSNCSYDPENNKNCSLYFPIKIKEFNEENLEKKLNENELLVEK